MKFYSRGKLLITSEYLVLKGALALAVPLNKGQKMVIKNPTGGIRWRAKYLESEWLNVSFDNQLNILQTNSPEHAKKLQNILRKASELAVNGSDLLQNKEIETTLEFNPQWGWGSSSTLIHLISQWLKVDPYQLLEATFGGSGYDIACAGANQPLFIQKLPDNTPIVQPTNFHPPFIDHIGVVWLNRKQNSSTEVKRVLQNGTIAQDLIAKISEITKELTTTKDIDHFQNLIREHEEIVSSVTGLQPVQQKMFPGFHGTIKSLGAWGGDFILFVSNDSYSESVQWFSEKGYHTAFKLAEIVLQPQKNNPSSPNPKDCI